MTKPASANARESALDDGQPLASLLPLRSSRLRAACRFPKLDAHHEEIAQATAQPVGGDKRSDEGRAGSTAAKPPTTPTSLEAGKNRPLALHQRGGAWSNETLGNDASTGCGSVASFAEHGDKRYSEVSADAVVIHTHSDAEEEDLAKEDGNGQDNAFSAAQSSVRKASDRETPQGVATEEGGRHSEGSLYGDVKAKRALKSPTLAPFECRKEDRTSFTAGMARAAKRRRPTTQSPLTVTTDGSLTALPFNRGEELPSSEHQQAKPLDAALAQKEGALREEVCGVVAGREESAFHIPSPFGLLRKKLFEPLFGSFVGSAPPSGMANASSMSPVQDSMSSLHAYSRRTNYGPHRRRSVVAVASRLALTKLYPFNRGLKLDYEKASEGKEPSSASTPKIPDFLKLSSPTSLDVSLPQPAEARPPWYTLFLPNLADEELGARILFSTDDFFGTAWNLLNPDSPKRFDGLAAKRVTDGWETRRRRCPGHDWCLIELGTPAFVYGIEADTRCTNGNQAPYISIEAANCPTLGKEISDALQTNNLSPYTRGNIGTGQDCETISIINLMLKNQTAEDPAQWRDIVSMASLGSHGSTMSIPEESVRNRHFFAPIDHGGPKIVTHLRLNLFPDGGLARLRVYGIGVPTLKISSVGQSMMNLTAATNGAAIVSCNDQTYGVAKNLLLDTIPQNPSSGWLTRRNPGRHPCLECDAGTGTVKNLTGENWVIIKLAFRGIISAIDIDTTHYVGDAPEHVLVQAADLYDVVDFLDLEAQSQLGHSNGNHEVSWKPLLPLTRLAPNAQHTFKCASLGSFHASERRSRLRQRASNVGARHEPLSSSSNEFEETRVTLASPGPGAVTHLKMTIYPDGGVARLRVWGTPEVEAVP